MSHFPNKLEKAIEDYQKASKQVDALTARLAEVNKEVTKLTNDLAQAQATHDQAAIDLVIEAKKEP